MPQNKDVNWLFSRAFLATVPITLLLVYVTIFERNGLFLASGNVVGRDFVNYWMGGSSALAGHAQSLFVFDTYLVLLREAFGPAINDHNWSYPPHFLLLVTPFGALPYLLSLFVWTVLGMLVYLAACLKKAWRFDDFLILILAPASISVVFAGQNGLFTGALLVAGLRLMGPRPVLAGICFGLLTIKPQLGILLPFALLASRRWVVIASACVTAAGAIVLSGLVFGFETWWLYLTETWPYQTSIMKEAPNIAPMMPTVFMAARDLGLNADLALMLHMPFALMGLAAVVWAFWQKQHRELQIVVVIVATFVATPYGFYYDMPALAFAALMFARYLEKEGRPVNLYLVPMFAWLVPAFGRMMALTLAPFGVVFVLAFFALAVRELYLAGHPAQGEVEPAPAPQQA